MRDATARVIASNRYILGSEVEAFEREFAAYCGVAHCVGVANGTDALELALRAVGVGAEDIVLTVANAGNYSTTALNAIGARPRYVDIDGDLLMSPVAVAQAVEGARAVVVTHLYGRMAQVEDIVRIASAAGVPVVEDCAQAHGASRGNTRAGAFGAAGCFSFYPTKNLGALGDGGAVITADANLDQAVRSLRQYGWEQEIPGRTQRRAEQPPGRDCRQPFCVPGCRTSRSGTRSVLLSRVGTRPALPAFRYACRHVGRRLRCASFRDSLPGTRCTGSAPCRGGIGTDIHYPIADHEQPIERGRSRSIFRPPRRPAGKC